MVDDDVVGGIGAVGRCDAVADVGGRTVRIVADPHPPSQRLHPLPVLSSPIHLRCAHYGKRHPARRRPTHTDDVVVARPWFKPQNGKWEEPRLLTGVLPTAQDGSPTRATGRTWVAVVMVGVSRSKRVVLRESGPQRWARWRGWLQDGTCGSRAEVARREGVSRAAVTQGLGKLEEPSKLSG